MLFVMEQPEEDNMSNVIQIPIRHRSATPNGARRTLKAEVAELRRLSAAAQAATADFARATARLEEIDMPGRARQIKAAKLASL